MDDCSDLILEERFRIQLEHLLYRAEPGYATTLGAMGSIEEVLAGGPPRSLFMGANEVLASHAGIDLTRGQYGWRSLREVCESADTNLLTYFVVACIVYLRSIDPRAVPVPSHTLEARVNELCQQWRLPVTISGGDVTRIDLDKHEAVLEQKFQILLSPTQESSDFDRFASELAPQALPIALLFLDIDNFKAVNTQFGEVIVDKLILPPVQRHILSLVCRRGHAYRHGGEEFVVLLPNHTLMEAAGFAERLRAAIAEEAIPVNDSVCSITVSIGVAVWPSNGTTLEVVLASANSAEHKAKERGKNRVELAADQKVAAT